MTQSRDLWPANQDLAQACLEHPLVRGIATGTLPVSRFAYYVGQDTFFLQAFARAYCIAAAIAPEWEAFEVFHALAGGALEEVKLHHSYAAEWGVDLGAVAPAPATRRYTDFLLATAWGADVGLRATAISPWMRLYAFLGQKLAEGGIAEHRYAGWIGTYSSAEFEFMSFRRRGNLKVSMAHRAWRIGHRAWRMGKMLSNAQSPIPNAQCPIPNAQSPIPIC